MGSLLAGNPAAIGIVGIVVLVYPQYCIVQYRQNSRYYSRVVGAEVCECD